MFRFRENTQKPIEICPQKFTVCRQNYRVALCIYIYISGKIQLYTNKCLNSYYLFSYRRHLYMFTMKLRFEIKYILQVQSVASNTNQKKATLDTRNNQPNNQMHRFGRFSHQRVYTVLKAKQTPLPFLSHFISEIKHILKVKALIMY